MEEDSIEYQNKLKFHLNISNIISNMDNNNDNILCFKKSKIVKEKKKANIRKYIISNNMELIKTLLTQRMPIKRIAKKINCNYCQLYKSLKKKGMIPDIYKRKVKKIEKDKIFKKFSF